MGISHWGEAGASGLTLMWSWEIWGLGERGSPTQASLLYFQFIDSVCICESPTPQVLTLPSHLCRPTPTYTSERPTPFLPEGVLRAWVCTLQPGVGLPCLSQAPHSLYAISFTSAQPGEDVMQALRTLVYFLWHVASAQCLVVE